MFLKRFAELQRILTEFVVSYEENNRFDETKRLDVSSYLVNNIRALPLDVNSTLKFNYFKNVFESYDQNLSEIIVFSHSLLAFSSLPKEITAFFQSYFYGTGEPFKYDANIISKKLRHVAELSQIAEWNKYGTFFNSLNFGLGNIESDPKQSTISLSKKGPPIAQTVEQDLLGLSESERVAFPEVYLTINGEEQKYMMTYFLEKKMLFVTFYKSLTSK